MKIVIFGLSVSSSWGNGHATLWRGLCRALGEQGHRIVFFEKDVPYYRRYRDLEQLPGGGRLWLYPEFAAVRSQAERELQGADVAIVTSYCADARAATRLLFDCRVASRVFYDLDTPVTLHRLETGEEVEYLPENGLGDFDLVLSYTGGRALDRLRTTLGARRVAPLYGSVDPAVHRPVAPTERYAGDLSHLGTWSLDRHDTLLRLFVEPAKQLTRRAFVLGGSLYPTDFPKHNIRHFEHVSPNDHPSFYCSSQLTLNVTRGPMAELGYCPSGRLFEAAACGVPIVSDAWDGLESFYTKDEQILIAHTTEEIVNSLKLSALELARIGQAARERTLTEHTAFRRSLELLRLLESSGEPGRSAAE